MSLSTNTPTIQIDHKNKLVRVNGRPRFQIRRRFSSYDVRDIEADKWVGSATKDRLPVLIESLLRNGS